MTMLQKIPYNTPHPAKGESFHDLCVRLEPVILGLEAADDPVFIYATPKVVDALFCYIHNMQPEDCVQSHVPPNSICAFEYDPLACRYSLTIHNLDDQAKHFLLHHHPHASMMPPKSPMVEHAHPACHSFVPPALLDEHAYNFSDKAKKPP